MLKIAAVSIVALFSVSGCKPNGQEKSEGKAASGKPAETQKAQAPPSLLIAQAQFLRNGSEFKPGPAKLTILRPKAETQTEILEDPDSNVFHKALEWQGGILTIGGEKALLKHWTKNNGKWTATKLWEKNWGGKFNRLRDIEIGDVTGDKKPNLVIATHDQGVIAIGSLSGKEWKFEELFQTPDTFVHEIELGDLDGDGALEIYATPSARNRSDGTSQAGKVLAIKREGKQWATQTVVSWNNSHAKEILVADIDKNGTDELYVVREGHVEKSTDGLKLKDPVTITRYLKKSGEFHPQEIATLEDRQARFALASDLNHDGVVDLAVSGMNSGLHLLQPDKDGAYSIETIDTESGGFEHAIIAADLDQNGKAELYVAADREKQIRRYLWNGSSFSRKNLLEIPADHITWNLQMGRL